LITQTSHTAISAMARARAGAAGAMAAGMDISSQHAQPSPMAGARALQAWTAAPTSPAHHNAATGGPIMGSNDKWLTLRRIYRIAVDWRIIILTLDALVNPNLATTLCSWRRPLGLI
jgi:hypothetical protein